MAGSDGLDPRPHALNLTLTPTAWNLKGELPVRLGFRV